MSVKLAALKHAINAFSPVLLKLAPGIGPRRPVSLVCTRLFRMLRQALKLHPVGFYEAENFPQLLQALERSVVFIAEEDGHYAGWLAEAMLLVHDLVAESRVQFPPGQEGDVAWIHWASQQPITRVKAARQCR